MDNSQTQILTPVEKTGLPLDMIHEIMRYLELRDIMVFSRVLRYNPKGEFWNSLIEERFGFVGYEGDKWPYLCKILEVKSQGSISKQVIGIITLGYGLPDRVLTLFSRYINKTNGIMFDRMVLLLQLVQGTKRRILFEETVTLYLETFQHNEVGKIRMLKKSIHMAPPTTSSDLDILEDPICQVLKTLSEIGYKY